MGEATKRYAVYEDLLNLPDHLIGEILNGVLETHPRPAPRHARASSSLGGKIITFYDHGEAPAAGGFLTSLSCTWMLI